jgi:hypothetical protein
MSTGSPPSRLQLGFQGSEIVAGAARAGPVAPVAVGIEHPGQRRVAVSVGRGLPADLACHRVVSHSSFQRAGGFSGRCHAAAVELPPAAAPGTRPDRPTGTADRTSGPDAPPDQRTGTTGPERPTGRTADRENGRPGERPTGSRWHRLPVGPSSSCQLVVGSQPLGQPPLGAGGQPPVLPEQHRRQPGSPRLRGTSRNST